MKILAGIVGEIWKHLGPDSSGSNIPQTWNKTLNCIKKLNPTRNFHFSSFLSSFTAEIPYVPPFSGLLKLLAYEEGSFHIFIYVQFLPSILPNKNQPKSERKDARSHQFSQKTSKMLLILVLEANGASFSWPQHFSSIKIIRWHY